MYISFKSLKELVKLPKNLSAQELAGFLNLHTVEVEKIIEQKNQFANIVVAEVIQVEKHPKADRLQLVDLDIGQEKVRVVCGATNVAEKQKVALALPGAVLASGLEVVETEIRGEKSFGMICAEDELGLGEDHEGILILDKKAKVGKALAEHLGLDDIIFEIDNKSLSHRGDLWGHYGLAREIRAILKTDLKPYSDLIEDIKNIEGDKIKIKIENKELCPRYLAWRVNNIKVTDSPDWLKKKIIAAGFWPVNNIVDATNYVMIESGQPLHAFSAEGIDRIIVRLAKQAESLETLDGQDKVLSNNDLVIASDKDILAIAGVIGGLNSRVNLDTNSIILESATFDPISIRKTAQALNLRTEASARFEKSLDPNLAPLALKRLATIIKKICPTAEFVAEASQSINIDLNQEEKISFSLTWLNKRLGQEIPEAKVTDILSRLGFLVEKDQDIFTVKVPSWRAIKDVKTKEDVLEEVARIFGYNNIEPSLAKASLQPLVLSSDLKLERKIKDFLSQSAALNEAYNYAFVGDKQLMKMGIDISEHFRLVNPSSENYNLLRQSLVPNLIQNIVTNQFNFKEIALFEIGRVFLNIDSQLDKDGTKEKLPYQDKKLTLALAGFNDSFSKLKGIIQSLMIKLFGNNINIDFLCLDNFPSWADNNYLAKVKVADQDLGLIADLKEEVANKLGVKLKTSLAELDLTKILDIFNNFPAKKYQAPYKYPVLTRDLAFVLPDKIMYNELYRAILNFSPLIVSADLFDVYSGSKLGANLKSLAFHVNYYSPDKTLSNKEIDNLQNKLLKFLKEKFEAQLRDF